MAVVKPALREERSPTMSTKVHPLRDSLSPSVAEAHRPVQPVQIWFWIGIVLLAIQFWYTAKWVMSDQFVAVPTGPDVPPEWMRNVLDIGQIVMTTLWCFSFFWFVLRPLLRGKRVGIDGLMMIGLTLSSGWDALSDVGQYWFTYNAYLVNRGSMLGVMPITLSPHAAGVNEAWPMFFIDTTYGNVFYMLMFMCAVMRRIQNKWRVSAPALIAISFVLGGLVDFVFEGVVILPLGFYSYAGGGHWAVMNADTYYRYPLHEMIFVGFLFGSLACMRYFVNDKGETFVERGLDKVAGSPMKKGLMRAIAVTSGVISIFAVTYHLPVGILALHTAAWPDDTINRSYFTNGICGPQVNLACPGPTVPIARPGAPRPDMSGHFPQ
jgi:hypothetical protein